MWDFIMGLSKLQRRNLQKYCTGTPKFLGPFLAQGHTHFFLWVCFMMGLGKPTLCTKFEAASFSHGVNIEKEPPNFGELP